MSKNHCPFILFIGFDEATKAFCVGFGDDQAPFTSTFDLKYLDVHYRESIAFSYSAHKIAGWHQLPPAPPPAEAVFCLVTADQAKAAAQASATSLPPSAFWVARAEWQDRIAALHLTRGVDDIPDRADRIWAALS